MTESILEKREIASKAINNAQLALIRAEEIIHNTNDMFSNRLRAAEELKKACIYIGQASVNLGMASKPFEWLDIIDQRGNK